MNIHMKDTLTLSDGKKYVVVSKIFYDNKNYYYLIDQDDYHNIMFCYENGEELTEITDKAFITKLLPMFMKQTLDELNS